MNAQRHKSRGTSITFADGTTLFNMGKFNLKKTMKRTYFHIIAF